MSWIQKLYETYNNCESARGKLTLNNEVPLLPICHTTNKAQIEIVIDHQGNFKRARVVAKDDARTIIPCTEKSAGGRTSGEAPHPLADKLQYVAKDYEVFGGDKKPYFKAYLLNLEAWCISKNNHPKATAVLSYVCKGNVVKDLIEAKILIQGSDGKLLRKWEGDKKAKPYIFSLFQNEAWQADAFVRWEVEVPDDPRVRTWEDETLWNEWIDYYSNTKKEKSLCYVTGEELFVADLHPAKLRNDGDKAKLISSNDWDGFTFRGRFTDTKDHNTYQTCGVGFDVSQKAHSALRWLISRQGYRSQSSDQVIVSWATSGLKVHQLLDDAFEILGAENLESDETSSVNTNQDLAIRLRKKIAGYKAELGDTSDVVVMGLDSMTQGRMALTFYRELTGSDFLSRVDDWHETCSWIHNYRFIEDKENRTKKNKYFRFVGAPAPKDIAEAAYGNRSDDSLKKLRKAAVARLLPCIIDGQKIPRDIVGATVRRACNRVSMEEWEWNKTLSIACSLYKKFNEEEEYSMALDRERKSRDYLYGRLLAAADCLERFALVTSEKKRDTNASRMMQRFADRPCSTWKTIELSLKPYKARLGGRSKKYLDAIGEAMCLFDPPEEFTIDEPLTGEFLLGYYCQREALKPKKGEPQSIEESIISDDQNPENEQGGF
ncbi:MAG: type I-C CRISPR-associated protein Cas8c/Csd1 [Nitrospiraceae bacterium]|nr:type I-C CRISPR-associated protein Cas8c/Csd1 [Nitrospiraceae bacterium]